MSLPRIAVDAMGGDEGVRVMVEGAAEFISESELLAALLFAEEHICLLYTSPRPRA